MTPISSTLSDPADLLAAADAARYLTGAAPVAAGAAVQPAVARGEDLPDAAIDAALQIQDQIGAMRRARGEIPLGYKIGFTNRTIWPLYGVHHPIWGPVWSTTVTQLDASSCVLAASRWIEPRLEPEIVIGLRASPELASAGENAQLIACIDWVAHGFEIVQSVYPGWKFDAAQAIAAQGLHGALLIGPRVPIAALGPTPDVALASLRLTLTDGERLVAEGVGSNVLDGPVQALGHLVAELGRRGERLANDAIVTTGTLTDAQPLAAGQQWRTRIDGVPLHGLRLEVK